jgi:hypothetical protein
MLKDIVKNREEQSVRGPSEAKHEWDFGGLATRVGLSGCCRWPISLNSYKMSTAQRLVRSQNPRALHQLLVEQRGSRSVQQKGDQALDGR